MTALPWLVGVPFFANAPDRRVDPFGQTPTNPSATFGATKLAFKTKSKQFSGTSN